MKKSIFSFVLAVYMLVSLIPTTALAADSYGMIVGGIEVTAENCQNITGPGISGKVSYDPAQNILTFDNATVTGYSYQEVTDKDGKTSVEAIGVLIKKPSLTVAFIGNNEISIAISDQPADICSAITSESSLTLQAAAGSTITVRASGAKDNVGIVSASALIMNEGTFLVESGSSGKGMSYGILADSLESTSSLIVKSGDCDNHDSVAIATAQHIYLNGTGSVSVHSGNGAISAGIICGSELQINVPADICSGTSTDAMSIGIFAQQPVTVQKHAEMKVVISGEDSAVAGDIVLSDELYWDGNKKAAKPSHYTHAQQDAPIKNASQYRYIRILSADLLPEIPFGDVPRDIFYTAPVVWAVRENITAGTTPVQFSPDSKCTRAQTVTFLWRAAGCPESTVNTTPFTDVKENTYYYKAVLWAVEKEITSGMTPTTFEPETTVTRGQVVTFLWRAQGEPEIKRNSSSFTDVSKDSFYTIPVFWAVENEITSGMTATTFEPNTGCTRGQIVTFLWRNAGEPDII